MPCMKRCESCAVLTQFLSYYVDISRYLAFSEPHLCLEKQTLPLHSPFLRLRYGYDRAEVTKPGGMQRCQAHCGSPGNL